MPPVVYGGEGVLHDPFGDGQVRYQQGREPDQWPVVRLVQVGDCLVGVLLRPGVRDLAADTVRPPCRPARWRLPPALVLMVVLLVSGRRTGRVRDRSLI